MVLKILQYNLHLYHGNYHKFTEFFNLMCLNILEFLTALLDYFSSSNTYSAAQLLNGITSCSPSIIIMSRVVLIIGSVIGRNRQLAVFTIIGNRL